MKLGAIDELALDLSGTVLERLDPADGAPDLAEGAPSDDDEVPTGALTIAVDLSEAAPPDDATVPP